MLFRSLLVGRRFDSARVTKAARLVAKNTVETRNDKTDKFVVLVLLTRQSDGAKYVDMTKIDEIGEPKPVIKHIKIKKREADKIIFRNHMRARKKEV